MDDRKEVLLWLPSAFAFEVAAWEIGSRLGLGIADPSWDEFGRLIGVERVTWGLAGASAVVLVLCLLLGSRRRTTTQLSLVQLPGLLTLACYWVGASLFASAVAIAASTFASLVIIRRANGGRAG